MIEKQGKLFINGKLQERRYDRNESYGSDCQTQPIVVTFFEIIKEIFWKDYKITISKKKEVIHGKDFTGIAFDPEETNAKKD